MRIKTKMSTKFKKLISYLFVLAVLVVGFGFAGQVSADDRNPNEPCVRSQDGRTGGLITNSPCFDQTTGKQVGNNIGEPATTEPKSPLEEELDVCDDLLNSTLIGCVQWLVYFIFVTIPSMIMGFTANLFNLVAAMTLSSGMYQSPFIQEIWVVVRDLANVFFILILLYAALQIILNLGNGSSKKIVANVILIALLVNFSLFFTKVVIDSSNIAALIFYNRIDTTNTNYNPIRSDTGEKDMAGALVSKFKINNFFSGELIEDLKKDTLIKTTDENKLSPYLTMGMMLVYGLVAYALCYAFFMVAMALFGRMLNLMMLMIISPVAFVTKSIPSLSKKEYMGFDSWLEKLIQTAFMATIFMFILYMTATILNAKIFDIGVNASNQGATATLVKLFMPAILIVALLLKGVKHSMAASGEFTGMVMKGVGFAGGAAMGVGGILGRASIGRIGTAAANSGWAKQWQARLPGGEVAMAGLKKLSSGSFDVRKSAVGGAVAKATGVNFESVKAIGLGSQEGGFAERRKKDMAERQRRADEIKVGEDEVLKQNLNRYEDALQNILHDNKDELDRLDRAIETARQNLKDAATPTARAIAETAVRDAKQNKVDAKARWTDNSTGATLNMAEIEDRISDSNSAIETENRNRQRDYANKIEGWGSRLLGTIASLGQYSFRNASREAAHDIRMGAKLKTGEKT